MVWFAPCTSRLAIHLVFPADSDNTFDLDIELKGVVEVETPTANMFGTKLEIKMKKAESVSWAKLDIPKVVSKADKEEEEKARALLEAAKKAEAVDALDLDDLDLTPQRWGLSQEAKTKSPY